MSTTVKKREASLIKALTIVCEDAKGWADGFEWLTHTVRYNHFPGSLLVTCVFSSDAQMQAAEALKPKFCKAVHAQLLKMGVVLKQPNRHVRFDSEERCEEEHDGDWESRLARFSV